MIHIERKYLPSKKFLVALSIAIILVLSTIALVYSKSHNDYNNNGLVADINATSSWLDGSSKIDPSILAMDQKSEEEYQKLNPTEKLARDLISNIIASQPTNSNMDQATIDALVAKALQDIPDKQYPGITMVSDLNLIKINQDTIERDISFYKSSYFTITEDLRNILGNDLKIINTYMTTGKMDQTALSNVVSKYQAIVNKLIKIPLPATSVSQAASYHLSVINDLEKIIAIDNDIIKEKSDSASAFADLILYNSIIGDLSSALATIDTVFGIKRVNY